MLRRQKSIAILMADDDPDDRLLTLHAFQRSRLRGELRFVEDGEDLMDYLKRRGKYLSPATSPRPDLILLDLNMPRKQGHEALHEIKADPRLRQIPVVVLTTSRAQEDIFRTYDLGANSFISKPATFEGMLGMVRNLADYWFKLVELLPERSGL
ncbi:MAG: response regulator [Verrucomicrobia bacterium]|nr:response regulator [Verrucomicrobiota bacterium]